MGWERRSGHTYYYRKEWVSGRCVSTYCGRGKVATLFAALDDLDRERRQQEAMERKIIRSEFTELAATPPELTMLLAEARAEVTRALEAAGYHQHKRGDWRKRRAKEKATK
jgi:hypothetical protein